MQNITLAFDPGGPIHWEKPLEQSWAVELSRPKTPFPAV